MTAKEEFTKRDSIFAGRFPDFFADEEIVEKQSCPNYRCRGNVNYHCAYKPHQYNICTDKGAVNSAFFTSD